MNILSILVFIFIVATVFAGKDKNAAKVAAKDDQTLVLRGRVTFAGNSRIPIEKNAKLTVLLQDTSLMDAPAKLIAQTSTKLIRFPTPFTIKYSPKKITPGFTYSLQARVENSKKQLLYINDVSVRVTPVGPARTTSIDIPVIQVQSSNKVESAKLGKKSQWPELVGKKGEDAVKIIKKETGFTNVVIVKPGQPVTADLRTDRVFVNVNNKGLVTSVPMIA